jgi:hypothetical protein
LKADAQHLVRLSQDFERLDKVLETLASIEDRTRISKDAQEQYILATSAAYELQQLYTGFEKIIERHLHFTGSVITPGGARGCLSQTIAVLGAQRKGWWSLRPTPNS